MMYSIPSMYSVGKQYILDITGKAFTQEDLVKSTREYFNSSGEKQFNYTSQPTFPSMNPHEQSASSAGTATSESYAMYRKSFPQQNVADQNVSNTQRNQEGNVINTGCSGGGCSEHHHQHNHSDDCHSAEKAHRCAHCTKSFARRTYLKSHERVHSGEKPFNCMFCRKAFSQRTNVRSHERTHTGEKPYTCLICRRAFCQQNELRSHERVHTGARPYQCHFCPKAFTQLTNLRNHVRTHTGEKPFICVVCTRSFTQHNELKSHERIHTGEKPFNCSMCSKAFSQRTNLRNHERVHSGEKPFQCIYCSKSFSQRGTLKNHEHTHTTDKAHSKVSGKTTTLPSSHSPQNGLKNHEHRKSELDEQEHERELILAASTAEECNRDASTTPSNFKQQPSSVISKWVSSSSLQPRSQGFTTSLPRTSHFNSHEHACLGEELHKEMQTSAIRFQQVPTIPPVLMAPSYLHQMTQNWENSYNWSRGFPMAAAWNTTGKNIPNVYSHEGRQKRQKGQSGDLSKGRNINPFEMRKEIQSNSK